MTREIQYISACHKDLGNPWPQDTSVSFPVDRATQDYIDLSDHKRFEELRKKPYFVYQRSIFEDNISEETKTVISAVNSATNARNLGNSSCSNVNNNNTSNTNSNNGFRVVVRPWKYQNLAEAFSLKYL